MDADIRDRLIYKRMVLENDRNNYQSRLELLEPYRYCRIKLDKKDPGKSYYYIKPEGSDKYKYVGKETNRILRVKEAAHLAKAIEHIDHDIELVNSLLHGYIPYDDMTIDRLLPLSYRTDMKQRETLYDRVGKKWKEKKLEYQKQFPENYPERKTETASDGVKVKSKNEAIIYNKLLDSSLYHIYELPLVLDDYGPPMYPDFTVLSPIDMASEIIIEHIGKLNEWEYVNDFAKRVRRYILAGYVPGVNLFFTFNDKDGHIDSLQITKVIADILGIR